MQQHEQENASSTIRMLALLVAFLLLSVSCANWAKADQSEDDAKVAKARSIVENNQQATPAATPSKPETSMTDTAFQAGKGLAICLAILFIGAAAYKRLNPNIVNTRREQRMKVIDRLSLGSRSAVLLIEIDGRQALVGVAPDSVSIQPWGDGAIRESFESTMETQCDAKVNT